MYLVLVITVLPEHLQSVITVRPPLHHSIVQTTKPVVRSVSELPPRAAEALPRHRQPVVSVSRIPRRLSAIHSISVHYPTTVTLSLLSAMSPVHLQCLARACWAYPQFTTSVFSSTMSARLSSRQYVTDSSLKPPLDLGILSNLAKTLSEHCQSTVRALPGSHPHQVMYRQVVLSVSSKVILGASSNRLRGTPLPFSSLVTVSSSLFHLVPFVMMSSHHHRCLPPNAFKSPFKPLLKLRAFLLLVQRSFRSL